MKNIDISATQVVSFLYMVFIGTKKIFVEQLNELMQLNTWYSIQVDCSCFCSCPGDELMGGATLFLYGSCPPVYFIPEILVTWN